ERLGSGIGRLLPRLSMETSAEAQGGVAAPPAAPLDHDAVVEPTNQPPLIDSDLLAQLRQMQAMGKGDFVRKVFGLYLDQAPITLTRIAEAVNAGSIEQCARAAHALKSMSLNIGATRVAERAAAIERSAKIDGAVASAVVVEEVSVALRDTIRAIEQSDEFAAAQREAQSAPGIFSILSPAQELERALPLALQRNALFLLYQPIVERSGQQTCGVEALLRWRHEDRMVPPAEFVPIAERTGVIHQIGEWVLRQACTDALTWPSLFLAVNVSPIQFTGTDLAERFGRILSETDFPGQRLELEITE